MSAAAERLGVSRQTLHRILAGTSSVTAEMALRLGKLTGTAAAFWLNLQVAHDLWHQRRAIGKALDRVKRLETPGTPKAAARAAGRRRPARGESVRRAVGSAAKKSS